MTDTSAPLPKLDVSSLPGPQDIRREELENGIVFLARENFASPSVVISGFQLGGSIRVGSEQAGLADLMISMLMRGTKRRSFREIYESIESIGASLRLGMGKHSYSFFGKGLAEDLDGLIEILSDVLTNPSFPEDQFERVKAEKLTSLAIRDQNTRARAHLAFSASAYRDHPYGAPTSGFRETIEPLGLDELQDFQQSLIGPKGFVICVVGGIAADKAFATVKRFLGGWTNKHQKDPHVLPKLNPLKGMQREHVHLEGKIQSDIVMGVHGPSRFDRDYLSAALANNILGRFGMLGRIGAQVREAEGLAYYAYSSLEGGPGPGAWKAIAGVNPVNVERAIELIRDEFRKFITQGISNEELTDNQANFIGRLPLQLESNEGVSGALVHLERYDLGLDFYQRYPQLISSITEEQVLRTAQRFLSPDDLVVAVAGPIEEGG